jgi:hypothetical protein
LSGSGVTKNGGIDSFLAQLAEGLRLQIKVLVAMMLTDSLESGGGCQERGYTDRTRRAAWIPQLPPQVR